MLYHGSNFLMQERCPTLSLLKNLRPCYFGLCFVHMWIYCTTHRPSVSEDISTMAVMYLVQSATLALLLLVATQCWRGAGKRQPGLPEGILRAADIVSAVCMSLCALVLAGVLPVQGALGAGLAAGAGGIGVTWAYARWCQFYAKLDLRLAGTLVFLTMAVGSAGKAVIDLLDAPAAGAILAVIPWVCFACAALAKKNPPETSTEPNIYYNWRTVASLVRLTAGVAIFSLTFGMVQSVMLEGLPQPYHASVLVHHGGEIVLALLMVGWLAGLKRGLNFSRTWRIILVLMATALIFEPYIGPGASSFMLSLVRTAQTFLIVFLFLAIADVARHSAYNPVAVFAVGWISYSLPFTVGKMIGDAMVSSGQNYLLAMAVVVWILVMVTLFVMDASSDGNHLVFAELNEGDDEDTPAKRTAALHSELDAMAAGEVRASTQETKSIPRQAAPNSPAQAPTTHADLVGQRCEKLAQEYGLTRREGEILGLLVRGRSKAHIAEAFIISENTVRGHVKHIYAKLGIHNKQELLDLFEATEC